MTTDREGSAPMRRLLRTRAYADINARRCDLIRRRGEAGLDAAEARELADLRAAVFAMVRLAYPHRPIDTDTTQEDAP